MRLDSLKKHLVPYSMVSRRRTTINHAFAAAVAPFDSYDQRVARAAIGLLGQNPDSDLTCAYCGERGETWDHVNATVKDSRFSGHGHRIGNLLPCCKVCNSTKGGKTWVAYMELLKERVGYEARRSAIERYLQAFSTVDVVSDSVTGVRELEVIRLKVLSLLKEGDQLAARIRAAHPG